jgi:hypothetical protein
MARPAEVPLGGPARLLSSSAQNIAEVAPQGAAAGRPAATLQMRNGAQVQLPAGRVSAAPTPASSRPSMGGSAPGSNSSSAYQESGGSGAAPAANANLARQQAAANPAGLAAPAPANRGPQRPPAGFAAGPFGYPFYPGNAGAGPGAGFPQIPLMSQGNGRPQAPPGFALARNLEEEPRNSAVSPQNGANLPESQLN